MRGMGVLRVLLVFGEAGYASNRYKRGARALGIGGYVNDKPAWPADRQAGIYLLRRSWMAA